MRVWLALLLICLPWRLASADGPLVDRVASLIARGQQRAEVGDPLSAIAYFRDAIGHAPRDPRGYRALASAYLDTDQAQRAVEVYEAAIYACGERHDLLLALARVQDRCHRSELALLILRTLTERAASLLEAHELRAQIAERTGRFGEALDSRRAVLALRMLSENHGDLRAETLQVKALALLAAEADPLNRADSCREGATPTRRALADCR